MDHPTGESRRSLKLIGGKEGRMELFFAANKEMQNGFNRAGMKAFWVVAIVQYLFRIVGQSEF